MCEQKINRISCPAWGNSVYRTVSVDEIVLSGTHDIWLLSSDLQKCSNNTALVLITCIFSCAWNVKCFDNIVISKTRIFPCGVGRNIFSKSNTYNANYEKFLKVIWLLNGKAGTWTKVPCPTSRATSVNCHPDLGLAQAAHQFSDFIKFRICFIVIMPSQIL